MHGKFWRASHSAVEYVPSFGAAQSPCDIAPEFLPLHLIRLAHLRWSSDGSMADIQEREALAHRMKFVLLRYLELARFVLVW